MVRAVLRYQFASAPRKFGIAQSEVTRTFQSRLGLQYSVSIQKSEDDQHEE